MVLILSSALVFSIHRSVFTPAVKDVQSLHPLTADLQSSIQGFQRLIIKPNIVKPLSQFIFPSTIEFFG